MNAKVVEWTGAILGMLGSLLLALNAAISGYGFIVFLTSNVCWLVFGIRNRAWGLVTMQIGFTVTSITGIYNWFIKPLLA
jgi:Na+(H+)/acetate symporter ActP